MKKPFYLILLVFLSLLGFSLFFRNFQVNGYEIKKPDIISELSLDEIPDTIIIKPILNENDYFSDSTGNFTNYITDSRKDSLLPLGKFNKALRKTEQDKTVTRIAFLGDSMIEGDLVSQTLRYKLQKKFGGKGVGFVPIVSQVANFRKSIQHKYSSNWSVSSILNNQGDKNLGISGFVFKTKGVSSVDFKSPEESYDNLTQFYTVKLYFGKSNSEDYITYSGKKYSLHGNDDYNQIILNDSIPVTESDAVFHCSSSTNIYGFSFESSEGVFLDNYSVRGNTGIPLLALSQTLLKNTDNVMHYNLIILQYGLNIAEPETKDLSFYIQAMIPAVNNLKECFPNADILIMSVSDKCYKKGGKYITEPSILKIIEAQEQISKETGCAFWNLYQTMGGVNSMSIWVKNNLANKDFTHFNFEGAEIVGTYLYNQLMYSYLNYLKSGK